MALSRQGAVVAFRLPITSDCDKNSLEESPHQQTFVLFSSSANLSAAEIKPVAKIERKKIIH